METAVTVTFLCVLLMDAWSPQEGKERAPVPWLLLGAGIVRLAIIRLPWN